MKSYCLKCKKDRKSVDPKNSKTNNGEKVTLSSCAVCDAKKLRFMKKQQAEGLLSNLDLKTSLSKVLLLRDILF